MGIMKINKTEKQTNITINNENSRKTIAFA